MSERATVRNAADSGQVKRAEAAERRLAALERALAIKQLATYEGRAFCAGWIRSLGAYRSVYDAHGGRMTYNVGRQDVAHELMARLIEADPVAFDLMEKEARDRQRKDDATTDAAHTPPANQEN